MCTGGGLIEPYIEHLLPLIANQLKLHSLEILYDISKERLALSTEALQSIHHFLKRPHFQRLGLTGFKLPAEYFCAIVQEFLSVSASEKITLYICESELINTALARTSGPLTNFISLESYLSLTPKSLSIKYLCTTLPMLWSEHILLTLTNTALNLDVLDVSNCSISDPTNLLSALAYHPNLTLEVVNISGIALPEEDTCCKVLEDLFQNHSLIQEFHANQCGLGKPSFLTSLAKSFSANSYRMRMRLLALTKNGLSTCSKEILLSFFTAICSLSQLSEVGLSYNKLLPEHAELFSNAWKRSCHSKFSVLSWRIAPPPLVIKTWPPQLEPQDKQLNKSMLHDVCWNLLL